MISFTVWKSGSQYRGYAAKGHAGYGEEGSDIVCAAVSALTQTTANAIEAFTQDPFEQELSEDGGYLRMWFPDGLHKEASLLMDALVLGIQGIEEAYGDAYITLLYEEV